MIALLLAFAMSAPAPEPATAPAKPAATANAEADGLKPGQQKITVVCRTETRPNSRFGRRICRTPENIRKLEDQAYDDVNSVTSRSHIPFNTK